MSSSNSPAQTNGNSQASTPETTSSALPPEPEAPAQPDTSTHLVAFFANYPSFVYDTTRPALSELKRLMKRLDWDTISVTRSHLRAGFRRALVLQFNLTYGTDQNSLESWQNLCHAMRVENIPDKLSQCKKLVETIYVNLVDLVDMPNTGIPARLFDTEEDLSEYTKRTNKTLPREDARAGGLLKHLLRQIVFPRRHRKTKAKTSQG